MWNATSTPASFDARPEAVEVRVGGRAAERGAGAQGDDTRVAAIERPLELCTASSTSSSDSSGAAKMRSWWAKPQSSSSQRLNARKFA